jgi:hypothetical protein
VKTKRCASGAGGAARSHLPRLRQQRPLWRGAGRRVENVYAIIAGMAVALGMGENTKSMLITRALAK